MQSVDRSFERPFDPTLVAYFGRISYISRLTGKFGYQDRGHGQVSKLEKIFVSHGSERVETRAHRRERSRENDSYEQSGQAGNFPENFHDEIGHQLVGPIDEASLERIAIVVIGVNHQTCKNRVEFSEISEKGE